jgi:hypothetical protein
MHLVKYKDPILATSAICVVLYAVTPFVNYYAAGNQYQALCISIAMGMQNTMSNRPGSLVGAFTCTMTGKCVLVLFVPKELLFVLLCLQ